MSNPVKFHKNHKGKLRTESITSVSDRSTLSTIYTPGVGEVCTGISSGSLSHREVTFAGRAVAVITDGSAVLGLGDIGPEASLPVMEGKSVLFAELAGLDSVPLAIRSKDPDEFIDIVKSISLNFAAINLEDISSPECFVIEKRLKQELDIPVVHDDQHATAIAALAGLLGAVELDSRDSYSIVVSGVGAAGSAIIKLLASEEVRELIHIEKIYPIDSKGLIYDSRGDLNKYKSEIADITGNSAALSREEILSRSDILIGVSVGNSLSREDVEMMKDHPIIFALANPVPEIMPRDAFDAGASVVATGRSDFDNQVNNALIFPGLFKGMIEHGYDDLTDELKVKVAKAVFDYHKSSLTHNAILPEVLDRGVVNSIVKSLSS